MFDFEMRYLAVSHKWISDYSLGNQNIIGRSHYEIFPDISDPWKNIHRRCLAGESANAEEDLYKRMDGTEQWMRWQIIPWKFGDGAIGGIIMFTEDITRRKKLENQILRSQKLESLGIVAGGIAHDFNNILTAILGNISLAKSFDESKEELLNRLTEAEIATLRASELARQLLTFSKGGMPIKKLVSIQRVMEHSVHFALSGSNIQSQFFFQKGLWPVEIDEGQIGQVIQNLVINSKQAMPSGGTIRVEGKKLTIKENTEHGVSLRKGDYLLISIQDQGTGISKEHLSKIFDPYFTTKQEGSGLGLSISYSIIQRHNGYITVESSLGVGTTFFIYLQASSDALLSPEKTEIEVMTKGKARILVMDDEESVLNVAGEILKRLGYDTDHAKNGTEAVLIYKKAKDSGHPFDLVITDLTVPGDMGGIETLRRLKEIDPQVKVIVSSGYTNDSSMSDYKGSGFLDCLTKPYRAFELSETVKRVLAPKKSEE
jgi:two-component system cell cycle sensor histidine kinase/response regulator CckA